MKTSSISRKFAWLPVLGLLVLGVMVYCIIAASGRPTAARSGSSRVILEDVASGSQTPSLDLHFSSSIRAPVTVQIFDASSGLPVVNFPIFPGPATTNNSIIVTAASSLANLNNTDMYNLLVVPQGYLPIKVLNAGSVLSSVIQVEASHAVGLGDFNGDGIISLADLVSMIHSYNTGSQDSIYQALGRSPTLVDIVTVIRNFNSDPIADSLPEKITTSWLGNSLGMGANGNQMQYDVDGMFTAPDGTVYANALSLDASRMWGVYKNGANLKFQGGGAFYRSGGTAVTSDGTYVYYAEQQGGTSTALNANGKPKNAGAGNTMFVVRRAWVNPPANNQTACQASNPDSACFSQGYGYDGDMALIDDQASTSPPANIWGLAADPASGKLYIADTLNNQILVYSTSTMTQMGVAWTGILNVRSLAWDATDQLLWAVSYGNSGQPPQILAFAANGNQLVDKTITGISDPVSLAVNPSGELLVADNGPDQNVKIFSQLGGVPQLTSTFGLAGGVYASGSGYVSGQLGNQRFNGLTGVGADGSGNIYVSYNGKGPDLNEDGTYRNEGFGAVLESYNVSTGTLNWRLSGSEFFDGVDFVPGDSSTAFGQAYRYSLNYANTVPGTEATSTAFTLNRFKYPDDFRLNSSNVNHPLQQVVSYQGHTFLVLGDGYHLALYRFNAQTDGDVAVPAALFNDLSAPYPYPPAGTTGTPLSTGWKLWTDTNGDGQIQPGEWAQDQSSIPLTLLWGAWIDGQMNIEEVMQQGGSSYVVTIPLQGLSGSGVPLYDFSKLTKVALPALPNGDTWNASGYSAARVQYDQSSDTMYVSGNTTQYSDPAGDGGIGGALVRIDHWSTPSPSVAWEMPIPEPALSAGVGSQGKDLYNKPIAMRMAGSYLFVQYEEVNQMAVFDVATGRQISGMLTPGITSVGNMSSIWVDWKQGVHAVKLNSGEYVVLTEDDIYNKQVMYRWFPPSS